jgi:hypothetical protein
LMYLEEPHLGASFQVVRRHPHLLFYRDPLLVEVGFTPVDGGQRIGFPVKLGEVQLLEPGWAVTVARAPRLSQRTPVAVPAAERRPAVERC